MDDEPFPEEPPHRGKTRILIELAAIVFILWLPSFIGALSGFTAPYSYSPPGLLPLDIAYSLLTRLSKVVLIGYVVWRSSKGMSFFGFRRPRFRDIPIAVGLWFGLVLVENFGAYLTAPLHHLPGAVHHASGPDRESGIVLIVLLLAAAASEESLFRCYLCTRFTQLGDPPWLVVTLSSLMFASIHIYQGWSHLIPSFAFGSVLAVVFLNYRSIWPLILAHAGYNLWIWSYPG